MIKTDYDNLNPGFSKSQMMDLLSETSERIQQQDKLIVSLKEECLKSTTPEVEMKAAIEILTATRLESIIIYNKINNETNRFRISTLQTQINDTDQSMIYLNQIPKDQMYKLFIDKERQEEGEDAFDLEEPGYKNGMLEGFAFIELSLGSRIDADSFQFLHDTCITDVKKGEAWVFGQGYGGVETTYGLTDKRGPISNEGRAEWETDKLMTSNCAKEDEYLSTYRVLESGTIEVRSGYKKRATKEKVKHLFDEYYTRIEKSESRKDKLVAIARLCRALSIYHVFSDGNQRTIAFCLINKLLRENELSNGVILDNPYMFDGYYSTNEMVVLIENGIKNFEEAFPILAKSKALPSRSA